MRREWEEKNREKFFKECLYKRLVAEVGVGPWRVF